MRFCAPPLAVLLALAVGACASSEPSAGDAPQSRPNVILVHVDDLGWTDLGYAGSDLYQTPHIDRLAREGMVFTNAYAAAAICSPTRAALMTGKWPARLGITDWIRASFQSDVWQPGEPIDTYVTHDDFALATPRNAPYLPLEEETIAEVLKPAGYGTMHVGKWHLGLEDWWPQHQGFDHNAGGADFGQPPSFFDPYVNERIPGGIPHLPPRDEGEYLTHREAAEAVAFIEAQAEREEPFFLYLAHYAVHTPIQAIDSVAARYAAMNSTVHRNAEYAAMVESVDDAMGSVLEALERAGLAGNTLVLFTSDNGGLEAPRNGVPITDNAPLRSGKGYPYEGGIRVPAFAWWPGQIDAGARSDAPIISVDFMPTIAEVAGVPAPDDVDGVSLLGHLLGGPPPDRTDLFWHFPHYRYRDTGPYSIVRSGDWKLLRYYDPEPYGVPALELYNLADDLGETTNLADERPEVVEELSAKLDAWLERTGARIPKPKGEL